MELTITCLGFCCCYCCMLYIQTIGGSSLFQLLCVTPQSNSLALVYKDKHTMNYIEYINNKGCGLSYHTISALYKEKDSECQESEGEESDTVNSD